METLKQTETTGLKTSLESELGKFLGRECSLYYLCQVCALANKVGGGQWWLHEGSVVVEFGSSQQNKLRLVISENGFILKEQDRERITVKSKLKAPLEEVSDGMLLLESTGGTKIYLGIFQSEGLLSEKKVVVKREVLP